MRTKKKQSHLQPKKLDKNVPKKSLSPYFNFYTIALILAVLIVCWIRYRLAAMPLERDEGEYAYMGQLILEGIAPYKEAYNMKLPGTYFMYSLIMLIFGKTFTAIHIGLMFMNAATMVFLFLSFKRLFSPMTGLIAAATYGVMSISPGMLGFAAHATHFVCFYVSLALYFFARYDENGKLYFSLLAGVMFGLSFLMKQQALFFIIFGGIMMLSVHLLNKPMSVKKAVVSTGLYSVGVFIPYTVLVLMMKATGNFDKFWFWTVEYAGKYASGLPWEQGKELLIGTFNPIWKEFMILWLLAITGMIVVLIGKFSVKQKVLAISFSLLAFASVCPGFFFRQHYFINLLPAVGLMAGISLDYFFKLIGQKLNTKTLTYAPFIIFVLMAGTSLGKNKPFYFKEKPLKLCKAIYGGNPFVESVEIAKYIKTNSDQNDKMAILGSEPQILVYADRRSATGYIYTYAMMELHDYNKKMQAEMIKEIEKEKPKFMVFCNVSFSWLAKAESPKGIFDWFNKYNQKNYDLVGIADMVSNTQTDYAWDKDVINYVRKGKEYVMIFRRKGA